MIGLFITFFTGSVNQQTKRGYQNIDKRCKKYRSDTVGTSGRMLEENEYRRIALSEYRPPQQYTFYTFTI